ncbi:uncharacterized protein BDR25DRAFT_361809 [Lindgomyces ingoldianus]|uniref:Uncharacterized protein n=1 Tax=Lindgomyces ingoldianus TaxID=673940 RepID=A0ACB6QCT5_9PLEO|nr:uncharacterized protein BDR25DRAFT_361809 [Lindgomyces ingoldianus]KAF2464305.1 hypothetical protein BDR25DRAFT_361809 [Lindgomyces ingoldianus]
MSKNRSKSCGIRPKRTEMDIELLVESNQKHRIKGKNVHSSSGITLPLNWFTHGAIRGRDIVSWEGYVAIGERLTLVLKLTLCSWLLEPTKCLPFAVSVIPIQHLIFFTSFCQVAFKIPSPARRRTTQYFCFITLGTITNVIPTDAHNVASVTLPITILIAIGTITNVIPTNAHNVASVTLPITILIRQGDIVFILNKLTTFWQTSTSMAATTPVPLSTLLSLETCYIFLLLFVLLSLTSLPQMQRAYHITFERMQIGSCLDPLDSQLPSLTVVSISYRPSFWFLQANIPFHISLWLHIHRVQVIALQLTTTALRLGFPCKNTTQTSFLRFSTSALSSRCPLATMPVLTASPQSSPRDYNRRYRQLNAGAAALNFLDCTCLFSSVLIVAAGKRIGLDYRFPLEIIWCATDPMAWGVNITFAIRVTNREGKIWNAKNSGWICIRAGCGICGWDMKNGGAGLRRGDRSVEA